MKRSLILLSVALATATTFAQGLVNFYNTPATLISQGSPHAGSDGLPSYFGLFFAPAGTTDPGLFTFSGVYGTNQVLGRFSGGSGVVVPGWPAGTSKSFLVAGWSTSLGHDFEPAWMSGNFDAPGFFGLSSIGTGVAGGFDGTQSIVALNVFGGLDGLQTGFVLNLVGMIPEPSSLALAFLGLATQMIYRQDKNGKLPASGHPRRRIR